MEIHITQARCWRSKQCLTSISLNRAPGKLSWILNTYFKNKLPSDKKPHLNIGDAPKALVLVVFLENQQSTDITGNFVTFWGKEEEGPWQPPRKGQAIHVGKAAGKCHGSHALEES